MSITIYESVKKSIEFIEANLQNSIGVWDVADAVSYSQFYFSREFSRHTHISVYDYILRRKISESYKCLFKTSSKIIDLAFQYGFQSHEVYTRAFRKVFGENPSEALRYKPLAIYEPIDAPYLDFLYGLKVEVMDEVLPECFFEADSETELDAGSCFLALLSKETLLDCKSILKGSVSFEESRFLSFRLCSLKHKIRIHHNDAKLAFRYFIDHFYTVDEMNSNFILIKKDEGHIDIIIPQQPSPLQGFPVSGK
jgi:AraC-like DNA-binding protein